MSFQDDLKQFIESRLLILDPTTDLTPGSPVEVQLVGPIVQKVGEDPLDTDIPTFIRDRLLQEFPELATDNGGLLENLFTDPLQLMLEPLKRAIQQVKISQSVANADLMADDEADALGANFFEDREQGGLAGGLVRVFYASPTTATITSDKRFYTASNLGFFPVENISISAAQMLFNKSGNLFYVDVNVRAESQGPDYEVDPAGVSQVDDLPGVVKVVNLAKFTGGNPRETNAEYLGRIDGALTERSLGTKRGVLARSPRLFEGIRALQIVGAGDSGMDRDILTGTGEGFLLMAGTATLYGDWVLLNSIVYKDDGPDNDLAVQAGDTLRFHLSASDDPSHVIYTGTVLTNFVIHPGLDSEQQIIILTKSLSIPLSVPRAGRFAVLKDGFITVSDIPGGITSEIQVPNDQVHLGGHTDVFVRPQSDVEVQTTLLNVANAEPLVAVFDLSTTAGSNRVASAATNFVARGVQVGDLLVIETGADVAGTYTILSLGSPDTDLQLRLDVVLSTTHSALRARISRQVIVDLIEPKTPRLPFDTGTVTDLRTVVGSPLFRFDTNDTISFGASVGDTIRVLSGPDTGDFTIKSFDPILGGFGAVVDRPASASGASLPYAIFASQAGLARPLVRLKSLELLDSAGQATGIVVPYGDAVDVRPLCDFEGAGKGVEVFDKQTIVFPDLSGLWGTAGDTVPPFLLANDPATPGAGVDARYTQKLSVADGIIRKFSANGANPITTYEVNLPPFLWSGKRDKLLVFTTHEDLTYTADSSGKNRTSEIADAKIGDTLTLLDGPNQGNYLITDLRVLEQWNHAVHGHERVALVRVDPELRVDPIRTGIDFIATVTPGAAITAVQLLKIIEFATNGDGVVTGNWNDAGSGFWQSVFLPKLVTAMGTVGFTISQPDLDVLMSNIARSGFIVGPAARGNARVYFEQPVSCEFYLQDNPTLFKVADDASKVFRLDVGGSAAQILPESETGTPPTQWNRNTIIENGTATPLYVALDTGESFVKRGVRTGDVLEFYGAVDDIPSRGNMASSWLATTVAGSNVVRAIMPRNVNNLSMDQADDLTNQLLFRENGKNVVPGMLAFIDSGPDVGAYTITRVLSTDFTVNPPVVQFLIDRPASHSTLPFPALGDTDFETNGAPAFVNSNPNTFPMTFLGGETLKINRSSLAGTAFNLSTATHTFVAHVFANIGELVGVLTGGTSWGGAGPAAAGVAVSASGNELVIRSVAGGAEFALRRDGTSTATTPGPITWADTSIGYGASGLAGSPDLVVGTEKRLYAYGLGSAVVGQWISIYAAGNIDIFSEGVDVSWLGSFKITAVGTEVLGRLIGVPYVDLDTTGNFIATGLNAGVRWIRHVAPDTNPALTQGGGTDLTTQFVRLRLYDQVSQQRVVTVDWSQDPLTSYVSPFTGLFQLLLTIPLASQGFAHMVPYRVTRTGLRRMSSTAMSKSRSGGLYYIDLPLVGYGPGAEMNISETRGLILAGRFKVSGYTLRVENENLTYSEQERLSILLPSSVLPVGSTPDLNNEINLAGQNILITYNNAPLVSDLQRFYSSQLDRPTNANILARHFLPGYVYLDVRYTGGSDPATVAKDVIAYINAIDPDENALHADRLVSLVKRRNATDVDLPIVMVALFHGTDRSIRAMRSENTIGPGDVPLFRGTFQQAYFIPGPDTSTTDPRPDTEQTFLTRR